MGCPDEYTPIGHTANLAARIQVLAPIGSIAATEFVGPKLEAFIERSVILRFRF